MPITYLGNREKKNYKVSLFKPSGEYQGNLLIDSLQLDLKLQDISTITFKLPENIRGVLNPRLNEVLDNFEIEVEYGNIETKQTQKKRFVIRKNPLNFSDDVATFEYFGMSKEVMLEDIKIVNWPGILKKRYYETSNIYSATPQGSTSTLKVNYVINGIITNTENIQVYRIDQSTNVEVLLLKASTIGEVNETNYYFNGGNEFTIARPYEVVSGGTTYAPNYSFRVYYDADAQASGSLIEEYYAKDGLTIHEVLGSLLQYSRIFSIGTISADFNGIYRSNFEFNNTTVYQAIKKTLESFEGIIVFDTITLTAHADKVENYGEDKGLTFKYGKYLSAINKEIDSSTIATIVRAIGKNKIGLGGATATGLNSYENYDYYLDGATESGNTLLTSSRWMSDELSLALLIWLRERDSFDNELYGGTNPQGLFEQYYERIAERESIENALIEVNAKVLVYTDLLDTYNETENKEQVYGTFSRKIDGVLYTNPSDYYGDYLIKYKALKTSSELEIAAIDDGTYTGDGSSYLDTSQPAGYYGLNDYAARLAYIAAQLLKESFFTETQLDELATFSKEIVYQETTVDSFVDLFGQAKEFLNENAKPKVTVSIDVVDILQAGEAESDWDKIILGDKINIFFPRFNIDLEAQIKEISMNLDSYSMNIIISTIKRYNTNFGTYMGKAIRGIKEVSTNIVEYKNDESNIVATQSKEIGTYLEDGFDTNEFNLNAGKKDNQGNPSITIDEKGIEVGGLLVDLVTDTIKPSTSVDKIRIINGGIHLIDGVTGEVKTAITTNGIVARELYGQVLLGEQLNINDGTSGFYIGPGSGSSVLPVNDFGIVLEGVLGSSTVANRIVISKNQGIKMLQSASGLWDDTVEVFAADAQGNIIYAGKLKSSSDKVYSIDELVDVRFEYLGATRFTSYTDTNVPLYTDLGEWQLKLFVDGIEVVDYTNIGTTNPTISYIEWETNGNVTGAASNTNLFTPAIGAYSSNGGTVVVRVGLVGVEKEFVQTNTIIANKQSASAGAKYTWVKYSTEAFTGTAPTNGSLVDVANASIQQIGMAFNKDSNVESIAAIDYEWSAYKGIDGDPGRDGYAITFSNEAIVLNADKDGVVLAGQETSSKIQVFSGNVLRNMIVSLNGSTSGCSAAIDSTNPKEIIVTLSNFTADQGYAKFDIFDDDSPTDIKIGEKVLTFAKAKQGDIGYNIVLDTESGTILANQDGDVSDTFQFVINPKAYSGTTPIALTNVYASGQTNCDISVVGYSVTVTPLKFGDPGYTKYTQGEVMLHIVIDATVYDRLFKFTAVKVGENTYSMLVSNESSNIPADKDGVINSSYEESTIVSLYRGSEKLTSGYTISTSSPVNCLEKSIVGDIVTVGPFTSGETSGSININATIGSLTLTKTFTFVASKTGQTGLKGDDSLEISLDNSVEVYSLPVGTVPTIGLPYDVDNRVVTIRVNKPGYDITSAPNITPVGCILSSNTPSISTNTASVIIDKITAASGYFDFTVIVSGNPHTQRFTFSTVKEGADGAKGDEGKGAITIILNNESHTVTKTLPNAIDYSGSGTDIVVFEGANELTYDGSGALAGTYTVSAVGVGITPNASPVLFGSNVRYGDHSGMTSVVANITYQITGKRLDGTAISISKIQSFSQSIEGEKGEVGPIGPDGIAGYNQATIYIYKRATSASIGDIAATYTFSTKTLSFTSNTSSWSSTIPVGTDPIYVSVVSIASQSNTESLTELDFSQPVVLAENGTNGLKGEDGSDGLNVAIVYIYKRANTEPLSTDKPADNTTFVFAEKDTELALSFTTPNGWSSVPPASGGDNMYVRLGTASSTGVSDIIADTEWSDVKLLSSKGDKGNTGPEGPVSTVPGPGVVYRGIFSTSKTYYSTNTRKDVVRYPDELGSYYICNANGAIGAWVPNEWNAFESEFSSVATGLLLAEDATITKALTIGEAGALTGLIKSSDGTGYNSSGFFLGYNLGVPKFSLGTKLAWDGTSLTVNGRIQASSGNIGSWVISNSGLHYGTYDDSTYTASGMTLSAAGTIHTPVMYTTETGLYAKKLYLYNVNGTKKYIDGDGVYMTFSDSASVVAGAGDSDLIMILSPLLNSASVISLDSVELVYTVTTSANLTGPDYIYGEIKKIDNTASWIPGFSPANSVIKSTVTSTVFPSVYIYNTRFLNEAPVASEFTGSLIASCRSIVDVVGAPEAYEGYPAGSIVTVTINISGYFNPANLSLGGGSTGGGAPS